MKEKALLELDSLINDFRTFIKNKNIVKATEIITKSLAVISRFTSAKDPYLNIANRFAEDFYKAFYQSELEDSIYKMLGVVKGLHNDIKDGHLDNNENNQIGNDFVKNNFTTSGGKQAGGKNFYRHAMICTENLDEVLDQILNT